MISVFLGGTCNQSTWRDELLTMLDQDKVKAFNPVVDDWNEEAQINEDWHKANDDFCLYVLTPEMTGIYSIFEVADDSNKRSDRTIFCVLPERNGKTFSIGLQKNFLKIEKDLIRNGAKVCESLEEIAMFLNTYELQHSNSNLSKVYK